MGSGFLFLRKTGQGLHHVGFGHQTETAGGFKLGHGFVQQIQRRRQTEMIFRINQRERLSRPENGIVKPAVERSVNRPHRQNLALKWFIQFGRLRGDGCNDLLQLGFMLPFAFVWNPALMLLADPLSNTLAVVGGVIATLAVATVVEAFASKPVSPAERLLMLGSAIAAVSPFQLFAVAGIAIGAVLLARHLVAGRRASVQQNAAG